MPPKKTQTKAKGKEPIQAPRRKQIDINRLDPAYIQQLVRSEGMLSSDPYLAQAHVPVRCYTCGKVLGHYEELRDDWVRHGGDMASFFDMAILTNTVPKDEVDAWIKQSARYQQYIDYVRELIDDREDLRRFFVTNTLNEIERQKELIQQSLQKLQSERKEKERLNRLNTQRLPSDWSEFIPSTDIDTNQEIALKHAYDDLSSITQDLIETSLKDWNYAVQDGKYIRNFVDMLVIAKTSSGKTIWETLMDAVDDASGKRLPKDAKELLLQNLRFGSGVGGYRRLKGLGPMRECCRMNIPKPIDE